MKRLPEIICTRTAKTFKLLAVLMLAMILFAGCGKNAATISDQDGKQPSEAATADAGAPQESSRSIVIKIDSNVMIINGVSQVIDAPPIIQNERTLVPVRVVSEALSASVYWMEKTRQVRIVQGGKEIILTIDSKDVISDGAKLTMDVEPMIIGTRTYVPLRFVSENLGAQIQWDNSTREITITR